MFDDLFASTFNMLESWDVDKVLYILYCIHVFDLYTWQEEVKDAKAEATKEKSLGEKSDVQTKGKKEDKKGISL